MRVCILAAGRGTRSTVFGGHLHKALLPLGNRAVISHILDQFPSDTTFVVALGHQAAQVQGYLELAHGERSIEFVTVDNYDGPGSGPGYSLWCCRDQLREPFWFTACDTLVTDPIPPIGQGWLGVSLVDDPRLWCTVEVDGVGQVTQLHYKTPEGTQLAFTGIAAVVEPALFWSGLRNAQLSQGEWQINSGLEALIPIGLETKALGWRDTGTDENYLKTLAHYPKNFTFAGKSTDAIYLIDDTILKFFPDPEVARRRYTRGLAHRGLFAPVVGHHDQFFSYRFVPGRLVADDLDGPRAMALLEWLEDRFWRTVDVEANQFRSMCRSFYIDKSLGRLSAYLKARDLLAEPPLRYRGRELASVSAVLEDMTSQFEDRAIPSTFHGDLHADNVIATQGEEPFCLIDWRQDFGGNLKVGDRYYDLAKLLHTLTFSVEAMEQRRFEIARNPDGSIDAVNERSPQLIEAEEAFRTFCRDRYDLPHVEAVEALTFINMAPLYDRELGDYLYHLGRVRLHRAWERQ
jgi:dTDP-glucose pyrophosphorylase